MNPSWIQFFDPTDDLVIVERDLPHWSQAGTMCFITWRTDDSMPAQVLQAWHTERNVWLMEHGVDATHEAYPECLLRLTTSQRREFYRRFSDRWHQHLDEGHGECVLQHPQLAKIVSDSLQHFDGERYYLTDYVIMPNHVHLLAAFVDEASPLAQCKSWKQFTATQINRLLGRKGRFWQQDGFDHLIRCQEQFQHLRKYLRENPEKARLKSGQYIHFSKVLELPSRSA
jgi:putative transposase